VAADAVPHVRAECFWCGELLLEAAAQPAVWPGCPHDGGPVRVTVTWPWVEVAEVVSEGSRRRVPPPPASIE